MTDNLYKPDQEYIKLWKDGSDERTFFEAYAKEKSSSIQLVESILTSNPLFLEANLCRAGWLEDDNKRIEALETVLDLGDETLNFENLTENNSWWKDGNGRSFMRTMQILATEYLQQENSEDALELLHILMNFDTEDNLNWSVLLAIEYAKQKQWKSLEKLLSTRMSDEVSMYSYMMVLCNYYLYGKKAKSVIALKDAIKVDSFPIDFITGKRKIDEEEITTISESEPERMFILEMMYGYLTEDKGFMDWLIKNAMKD